MITSQEISRYFDRMAIDWDKGIKENEKDISCKMIQKLGMGSKDHVLDVGAGTGLITPFLLQTIDCPQNITAIDISPNMLSLLKAKFPHINTIQGDVHQMPFHDKQFDWVLCCNAFPHFIDQMGFIQEAKRILAYKGKLVVFHTLSRCKLECIHRKAHGIPQKASLPAASEVADMMVRQGFKSICAHEDNQHYKVIGLKV